jgi:hypothetical protein
MSEAEDNKEAEEEPANWENLQWNLLELERRIRDAGERMARVLQEHKIPQAMTMIKSKRLALQDFLWFKQDVAMRVQLLSSRLRTHVLMPGEKESVECATFEEAVLKVKSVLL